MSEADGAGEAQAPGISRSAFSVVFGVQVITAAGNTGMQSVLPAIGRESRIPDPMVAAIFSLSALLWAIGSPIWARQSDRFGRKPLIVVGLAGPMFGFAALALIVLVWVWRALPETWPPPRPVQALAETSGPPTKAPPLWKDPRIRPFLIYGLLVSACQTAQYQTLGFIV